jgi:hypothetical protein
MMRTAADYNALRALFEWPYGANQAQQGVVIPHLIAKIARKIRVKMPDGTFEGMCAGLFGKPALVFLSLASLAHCQSAFGTLHLLSC